MTHISQLYYYFQELSETNNENSKQTNKKMLTPLSTYKTEGRFKRQ